MALSKAARKPFNPLEFATFKLYLRIMNGKALVKILKENGWLLDRIKGSHYIFIKEGKRAIPVPVHGNKDLPKGLVNAILKQADIKGW